MDKNYPFFRKRQNDRNQFCRSVVSIFWPFSGNNGQARLALHKNPLFIFGGSENYFTIFEFKSISESEHFGNDRTTELISVVLSFQKISLFSDARLALHKNPLFIAQFFTIVSPIKSTTYMVMDYTRRVFWGAKNETTETTEGPPVVLSYHFFVVIPITCKINNGPLSFPGRCLIFFVNKINYLGNNGIDTSVGSALWVGAFRKTEPLEGGF